MLAAALASHHSATAFLNALFLEWEAPDKSKKEIIISLSSKGRIIIPIKSFSVLGRHHYTGKFFLEIYPGNKSEISFSALVQKVTEHLGSFFNVSASEVQNFLARVQNSQKNIELTLRKRSSAIEALFDRPADFKTA